MTNIQKYTKNILDVNVLHKLTIVQPKVNLTFIYNDFNGLKIKKIDSDIAVQGQRLDTFSIKDQRPSFKLPILKITSLRSLLITTRNFTTNLVSRFSNSKKYNDTVIFDARNILPNNIAHLMMHAIPLCLQVKRFSRKNVTFLFDKINPSFLPLLLTFGVNPTFTTRKVEGEIAKNFITWGLAAHEVTDLCHCSYTLLPNIYDDYKFSSGLSETNRIFIARRGNRGITNLAEVEATLKPYGYKTIFMEDYSIEVQLGIASEANEIVAVHGASMGMLTLRKKIQSMIEIMPPNAYNDYFSLAFGNKTDSYIQIMPFFDDRIPYNTWETILEFKNQPFSVDINQLKIALDTTHNTSNILSNLESD